MAVRSRMLGILTSVPAGTTQTLASVPLGRTGIVRQWQVMGRTAGAQTFEVAVRRGSTLVRLTTPTPLTAGQTLRSWADDLVLNPGDVVVIADVANTSNQVAAYASGSLLFGEPE